MSASATSVAHPSVPFSSLALCGPSLVPLSAFVYSIFPSGIRHCRSERLNHPLPGEKLRFSQNPLSLTENTQWVHLNHELCPISLTPNQSLCVPVILQAAHSDLFSRVKRFASRRIPLISPPPRTSRFCSEFGITRWAPTVSASLCEPLGCLLHSRHAARYVWLTACTQWPPSHSCSKPSLLSLYPSIRTNVTPNSTRDASDHFYLYL